MEVSQTKGRVNTSIAGQPKRLGKYVEPAIPVTENIRVHIHFFKSKTTFAFFCLLLEIKTS
jgi:hypothetical protein